MSLFLKGEFVAVQRFRDNTTRKGLQRSRPTARACSVDHGILVGSQQPAGGDLKRFGLANFGTFGAPSLSLQAMYRLNGFPK